MSKNDITGDKLVSKVSTSKFDEGFDRIFGKKDKKPACEHNWRFLAHGHNDSGYECTKCGEIEYK